MIETLDTTAIVVLSISAVLVVTLVILLFKDIKDSINESKEKKLNKK